MTFESHSRGDRQAGQRRSEAQIFKCQFLSQCVRSITRRSGNDWWAQCPRDSLSLRLVVADSVDATDPRAEADELQPSRLLSTCYEHFTESDRNTPSTTPWQTVTDDIRHESQPESRSWPAGGVTVTRHGARQSDAAASPGPGPAGHGAAAFNSDAAGRGGHVPGREFGSPTRTPTVTTPRPAGRPAATNLKGGGWWPGGGGGRSARSRRAASAPRRQQGPLSVQYQPGLTRSRWRQGG